MNRNMRAFRRVGTAGMAAAVFGLTVSLAGQAPAPPERTKSTYQPAKTAWGEPDISGMFNFSYVGTVPLERPCQPAGGGPGFGGSQPGGDRGGAPAGAAGAAPGAGARATGAPGGAPAGTPPAGAAAGGGAAGARRGGGPG